MSAIANRTNVHNNSPGPPIPSPGTLSRRGRRPALIPYSADLTAYISATTSSHPSFHISPFGTILGATFNPPLSTSTSKAPLFVLPPSLPNGGNPNTLKHVWEGTEELSPFGWASEEERSDEEYKIVDKGGRKRAMTTSSYGRKARLRRSLLLDPVDINAGEIDIDVMDVDDDERKEVEGDVFSWVNSSSPIDDFQSLPLPNLASVTQANLPHNLSKHYLQPHRPRKLNINDEDGSSGTWTVPTSPMSGTFGADLELQRRRLEEAGLGIESVVSSGFHYSEIEEAEAKA